MNNLPYVLALEKLAGIEVPDRVKTIRVMLCEIFRILSHLLYYGTFFQDVGAMTPVFLTFVDRQKGYDVIEAITGFPYAPGVVPHRRRRARSAEWAGRKLVREFLDWMPKRLRDYRKSILKNSIVVARSRDVAAYNTAEALEWGVTGAGLRATGLRIRSAQGATLLRLRELRVRHSHRHARRRLRPHARARRRNAPVAAHHRAVPEQHAVRSVQSRPSSDDPAAERSHAERHRHVDPALPRRVVGSGDAGRRDAAR